MGAAVSKTVAVFAGFILGLEACLIIISHKPRSVLTNGCDPSWEWDRGLSKFRAGILEFRDSKGHFTSISIRPEDAKDLAKALTEYENGDYGVGL
jgi:hypothetical protein